MQMFSQEGAESSPVLVVGAGPAGLTTALALARLGVRSTLLTRYPYTAHTPRAHVVNQRTMEIFRQLGIEGQVVAQAEPQSFMEHNPWITSLAGVEVARISAWGAGDADRTRYAEASPSSMCNLPQHLLEPILLEAVQLTGMVDLRFGHEFIELQQDESAVTARVQVRETGEEYTLRTPYLVGADGANSRVLEEAGLGVVGPDALGEAAFVWFEADLTRFVAHRPGILFPTVVPDGRPGLILVRAWTEWIAGFAADDPNIDWNDHDSVIAGIRLTIGDPTVKVRIKNIARWTVKAQFAPQYSRGRVFCMGDAVHRHTPYNGLGLNTSIGDAHNLAWKLAMVLKGEAAPALLETYSTERAPVGERIVRRATETADAMAEAPAALGMRPDMTPEEIRDQVRAVAEDSERGAELRAAFRKTIAPLAGPGYNALGVEVGYRYRDGAIVPDDTAEPVIADPDTEYVCTTRPGARIPHVWLEAARRRVSTLDLADYAGGLALFTGARAGRWLQAAADAAQRTRALLSVIEVGGLHGVRDPMEQWAAKREVTESGAVLVRPDGHVAWRAHDDSNTGELATVLAVLLGKDIELDANAAAPTVRSQSRM